MIPRPAFAGFGAIFYGPIMLAGLTHTDSLMTGNRSIADVVVRNSTTELSFEAQPTGCGAGGKIAMVPFNTVRNGLGGAAYTVYVP